jgi:hypothetical protein
MKIKDTMSQYEDSSYVSTSDASEDEDQVDKFFENNLDAIIDMYDEFRERFSHNPYFLQKLVSSNLTDFFIDCLFENNQVRSLNERDICVLQEYENEINISYSIVYSFLYKFKYRLPQNHWIQFCSKFS